LSGFESLRAVLRKQKYHFAGRYAAVKKCHWLHAALVSRRFCYKHKFYGIASHRCIQMTPTVFHCTHRCLHCWRVEPGDFGVTWNQMKIEDPDDPVEIVDRAIEEQRRILSGYKANPKVDPYMYQQALHPRHAAISLAGEPTLYPYLSELIEEFHRRGFTTFLVTNGTLPEVLEKITEPSQLYVSLNAPNEEIYKKIARPMLKDGWSRLMKTLELISSFSCPTVLRITLIKGYNMTNLEQYAKLIERAQPTYVEPKAYMHLGFSRQRLSENNMPRHSEVVQFAEKLSELTGYRIIDESLSSRVVLLSKLEKPIKIARD